MGTGFIKDEFRMNFLAKDEKIKKMKIKRYH